MSLTEIKAEIARLSAADREELALQLQVLKDLEDPAFRESLTEAHRAAAHGAGGLSKAEFLQRLGASGRSL